jgi:hypothetical protein
MLAAALFELRVLLAPHIGMRDGSAASAAAEFAYALHNFALATLDGKSFEVEQALESLERLEPLVGRAYLDNIRRVVLHEA